MAENTSPAMCTDSEWEAARAAGLLFADLGSSAQERAIHDFSKAVRSELLAELLECQSALSNLLGGDPDLISRICGSTTLGNRLVHVRAAIRKATGE